MPIMSSNPTCQDCQPLAPESTSTPSLPQTIESSSLTSSLDPLLDPTTFEPPLLSEQSPSECPRVIIEFCDRCRWLHRATWTQTELFLTFPPPLPPSDSPEMPETTQAGLKAITLVPRNAPETGGRFRVWLFRDQVEVREKEEEEEGRGKGRGWELVWDRKIEGGFPEMKVLKQRIRNLIAPKQDLGHSDKPGKAQ